MYPCHRTRLSFTSHSICYCAVRIAHIEDERSDTEKVTLPWGRNSHCPVPSHSKGIENQSTLVLQLKYLERLSWVRGVLRSERFFDMGVTAEKVRFLSWKSGMNSMALADGDIAWVSLEWQDKSLKCRLERFWYVSDNENRHRGQITASQFRILGRGRQGDRVMTCVAAG
jgi:hypothetical protein